MAKTVPRGPLYHKLDRWPKFIRQLLFPQLPISLGHVFQLLDKLVFLACSVIFTLTVFIIPILVFYLYDDVADIIKTLVFTPSKIDLAALYDQIYDILFENTPAAFKWVVLLVVSERVVRSRRAARRSRLTDSPAVQLRKMPRALTQPMKRKGGDGPSLSTLDSDLIALEKQVTGSSAAASRDPFARSFIDRGAPTTASLEDLEIRISQLERVIGRTATVPAEFSFWGGAPGEPERTRVAAAKIESLKKMIGVQ